MMAKNQNESSHNHGALAFGRRARGMWRRQFRPVWREFYWAVAIALFALTLGLGYAGFQEVRRRHGFSLDSLYESLQLFWLQSGDPGPSVAIPVSLEIARFGAPLVIGWAAVQAVAALIRQRVLLLGVRLVYGSHVVITGLGTAGFTLATAFYDRGFRVVVIELDPTNRNLAGCKERGIPMVIGNASDLTVLQRASAGRARTLIATCGDDATNLDVAAAVASLTRRRLPTVVAHVADLDIWSILRADTLAVDDDLPFRLEFFNLADLGSRALLREHPPFGKRRSAADAAPPSLLIVGLGALAESLVLHLARLWSAETNGEKLRVTIIDEAATEWRTTLTESHPNLSELCELMTIDEEVGDLDPEHHSHALEATVAYLCRDDELTNLAAGLDLRRKLTEPKIVIVVKEVGGGVGRLLHTSRSRIARLDVFGLLSHALTPELVLRGAVELIAEAMHEQYLATQRSAVGSGLNPSLVDWEDLPESLKESNRSFAAGVEEKLEASGCVLVPDPLAGVGPIEFSFTPQEIEELARLEHRRWVADLQRDGWKKTAGVKDPEGRFHPLLISWDELDEPNRDKDRDAVRAIPLMLSRAGLTIKRREARSVEIARRRR